jgi:CRP/FNR family transcriptional regulator, cyclic AMP receptor protein
MMATDVSALQCIPMFRDLSAPRLKLVLMASQRTSYRPGDCLIMQGGKAENVFIILEGKAKVTRQDGDESVVIGELKRGSVVGEIGVVLEQPYSSTIVAETSVVTLRIDKRTFIDLLSQVPQFSLGLIRELASRLLKTNDLYARALSQ